MSELSPSAEAVLEAAEKQTDMDFKYASQIAAAALRAAARCLEELPESLDYSFWCSSQVAGIDRGIEKLLTIADELEAQ